MRTRYQHLRSTTALARPAAGSGLPGQIWINMADEVLGWFNDAGAPVTLPFVKPPALAAYLPLAGGTMTGPLVLAGAPTAPLNPATKAYADAIDTAVRSAFAAADTQVRNDFTAADAALRAEFRAADTTLGNDINALATATSNALASKLALAGGTLTGPLVLAGAPTQPLQAATKKYVDDQIAAIPAPVIPPGTIISDTAPPAPKVGQLWFKTVDPVGLYIWYQDADSSQWVQVSGGGSGGQSGPVDIVLGAAGWQVVGDVLICWGSVNTLTTGAAPVVFPRGFQSVPAVSVSPNTGAAAPRLATFGNRTTTGMDVSGFDQTDARIVVAVNWIAVGPALEADRMPTTVGGAGGAGGADFASLAEARAGVRPDAVMSPALVQARSGIDGPRAMTGTQVTFDQVPQEANEYDIILNLNYPANAQATFDFAGMTPAGHFWSRSVNNAAWAGGSDDISTLLDTDTATRGITGSIRMVRDEPGARWVYAGTFRTAPTRVIELTGTVQLQGALAIFPRLNCLAGGGFTGGFSSIRWRI
jgi:hypothetical protein